MARPSGVTASYFWSGELPIGPLAVLWLTPFWISDNRNPVGRVRIRPSRCRHPKAGEPEAERRADLTEKVGRPEQACTGWGQWTGGAGGLV